MALDKPEGNSWDPTIKVLYFQGPRNLFNLVRVIG